MNPRVLDFFTRDPETSLASLHLKMDGWNTIFFLLGWPIFRSQLLVSGRVLYLQYMHLPISNRMGLIKRMGLTSHLTRFFSVIFLGSRVFPYLERVFRQVHFSLDLPTTSRATGGISMDRRGGSCWDGGIGDGGGWSIFWRVKTKNQPTTAGNFGAL